MKNKHALIATLIACCSIGPAYASDARLSMDECVEISSEINRTVPVVINKYTTLDTTFCTPGRFKPVLNYRAAMSKPKARLNNFKFASIEMKRLQTNSWCTDPAQRSLLRRVDVLNHYYDIDRKFVGQIPFKIEDCRPK